MSWSRARLGFCLVTALLLVLSAQGDEQSGTTDGDGCTANDPPIPLAHLRIGTQPHSEPQWIVQTAPLLFGSEQTQRYLDRVSVLGYPTLVTCVADSVAAVKTMVAIGPFADEVAADHALRRWLSLRPSARPASRLLYAPPPAAKPDTATQPSAVSQSGESE